ncbi:sensor histidine kinase [Cyanobacterium aponinum]|uniref:sensor histidine kinase n=1 Tax=Cyanobacterium aponinum TaxID=379064 RepID=UPI000C12B4A5|nr:HAMP domain-containing sensor histidine kinase [Cyanobacterium aponinum]PHV64419.1 histidine kinase [Cyanobacterium aponinum IPPAS B-1201]
MSDIDNLKIELNKTKIAYQEALQNNRLKAGFMGRIAHEIRSPLSSLMGLHQLIINDLCESREEEREFIVEAYQYAKKLMAIIDQFVEVSKLETGRINPEIEIVNLQELLLDIHSLIYLEAANKNLKIKLEATENSQILTVKTDREKLINIIFLLLEIVIDYSEMGEILLSTSQNNEGVNININFPCKSFNMSENIDLLKSPIEELKQLNKLPQLSNGMKLMLVENVLNILGGYSTLKQIQETETTQWQLFLPTEIV